MSNTLLVVATVGGNDKTNNEFLEFSSTMQEAGPVAPSLNRLDNATGDSEPIGLVTFYYTWGAWVSDRDLPGHNFSASEGGTLVEQPFIAIPLGHFKILAFIFIIF